MAWSSLALLFQNTSRTHCACRSLLWATPNNIATYPNNVLTWRVVSHELAVSFDNHRPSCNGHPSCINNPPMANLLAPVSLTSKVLSNFVNLSTSDEDNLILSSPKGLVTRLIPLLDYPFFKQVIQGPINFRIVSKVVFHSLAVIYFEQPIGEYIFVPRQHPTNVVWGRPIFHSLPMSSLELL